MCAVWYNLRRNGDGDYQTRHAACPVLIGTKWGKRSQVVPANGRLAFAPDARPLNRCRNVTLYPLQQGENLLCEVGYNNYGHRSRETAVVAN